MRGGAARAGPRDGRQEQLREGDHVAVLRVHLFRAGQARGRDARLREPADAGEPAARPRAGFGVHPRAAVHAGRALRGRAVDARPLVRDLGGSRPAGLRAAGADLLPDAALRGRHRADHEGHLPGPGARPGGPGRLVSASQRLLLRDRELPEGHRDATHPAHELAQEGLRGAARGRLRPGRAGGESARAVRDGVRDGLAHARQRADVVRLDAAVGRRALQGRRAARARARRRARSSRASRTGACSRRPGSRRRRTRRRWAR